MKAKAPYKIPYKILFIDFDGTLIDSLKAHYHAFNETFRIHNLPPVSLQKFKHLFGYFSEQIIKYLFPYLSENEVKKLAEYKKKIFITKIYKQVKLFPAVNKTLNILKKHYLLVLESNASFAEIKKIARFCKLNLNYFSLILSKEKVKHKKPDPELIKKAEKFFKLNKHAKHATEYVVGDSFVDVQLAKRAKVKSIIIARDIETKQLIRKYKPDHIIKNFSEIINITNKNI
ncbi:MAG: HAD family hydrolase [Candidatus Pacearchaeota archaeon]